MAERRQSRHGHLVGLDARMSIRLIAKDLYRLQQEVETLTRQLASTPAGQWSPLEEKLRRAIAERNRLRNALEGSKDRPAYRKR
jgi:hypothetical protein